MEMRTRLFFSHHEFLWQEGHTAHATSAEAMEETPRCGRYADFAGTICHARAAGEKPRASASPRGEHVCIEAMMQDRKALQAGTSHFLGQNFSHASGIQVLGPGGPTGICVDDVWGVSTRLIGGVIMAHRMTTAWCSRRNFLHPIS